MPYEIPAEIAYEEKIIFGLTFRQLFYCLIFSPIALAILFKAPWELPARIAVASVPTIICALFIFTNIPLKIIDWFRWLGWKEFYLMDDKMKHFLALGKIDKEAVTIKGKRLAIIKVEPINFSIKNNTECYSPALCLRCSGKSPENP